MAKGSELTEDKLEDLRQLGRELAISLQSPFVDLPELEAMEDMAAANGVSKGLSNVMMGFLHRWKGLIPRASVGIN